MILENKSIKGKQMALLKSSNVFDAILDKIGFLRKYLLQPKFEPLIVRFFLDVLLCPFKDTKIIKKHLRAFLGEKLKKYTFISTLPLLGAELIRTLRLKRTINT